MTVELTSETYDEFINSSDTPVIIDFWAPWCGPCKQISPVLDDLSTELSAEVSIVKINIDDHPEFIGRYEIKTIPALVVIKNGEYVGRVSTLGGFGKERLIDNIRIAISE